jgi:hypothetical protein
LAGRFVVAKSGFIEFAHGRFSDTVTPWYAHCLVVSSI